MLKSTASILAVASALLLAACSTSGPETPTTVASSCAGKAYDTVFFGGNYYDYTDRSTVTNALQSDVDPAAEISDASMRRLINVVGAEAAQGIVSAYKPCLSQGMEELKTTQPPAVGEG